MECEICGDPAAYEVSHTDVMGQLSAVQKVCDEHAVATADWILANNDERFAGPGEVIETLTFRLLHPEQYRAMVAGTN